MLKHCCLLTPPVDTLLLANRSGADDVDLQLSVGRIAAADAPDTMLLLSGVYSSCAALGNRHPPDDVPPPAAPARRTRTECMFVNGCNTIYNRRDT